MRLFIGLSLPEALKRHFKDMQDVLKPSVLRANFIRFDQFHITLKFIGKTRQSDYHHVVDVMQEVAYEHERFSLRVGGINSFFRRGKHLFYVEVNANHQVLNSLHKTLNKKLHPYGFALDHRRYNGHITIAREVILNERVNIINPLPLYRDTIEITHLTLFESVRQNGVLTYVALERIDLGKD